ncbi:hypothetical protein SLEP1_g42489 [Rubroshorea leprosula]|uniref:Uncharacterized protein n=1 Tax=Rubroshorea leprosula TaxID=152421 RepID=A0AAV5LAC6_9ROSI|nr:hypothetical protein SLEP1_g42489 [Rubroshorea leprosula]
MLDLGSKCLSSEARVDLGSSCLSYALRARPLKLMANLGSHGPAFCTSTFRSSCFSISHLGLVQFVTWTSAIRSSCSSKTFVAARAPASRTSDLCNFWCTALSFAAAELDCFVAAELDHLVAVELGCCAAAELVRCFGLWRCRAGPFGCCRAGPLCCCRAGLLCCCHQAELMFSPRAPRL